MPADCSLLISAWNEQELLPYVLSWCRNAFNDCVVLDDSSTDKTVEIAKHLRCRVFTRKSDPTAFGANIRLELQDYAQYDWCFHCDADELLDWNMMGNLVNWIHPQCVDRLPNVVAFKFPRYNPGGKAWPDYQIRLVNKKYVGWRRPIHPEPILLRTGKPIDEPELVAGKTVRYCQTLDPHPIIHLLRPIERWEETRKRWAQLEAASGTKPPTTEIVTESKAVPISAIIREVKE